MIANGINIIDKYKCILTGRDIQASQIFTFDTWLEQSNSPTKLREEKFKYSTITIKLLIEGVTEDEVLLKISNVIKDVSSCILKFEDMSYSFNAQLDSHDSKLICETAYELTLEFKSDHKLKDEVTVPVTSKTQDINNSGNLQTQAYVEILSTIDQIDMTLTGLTDIPIPFKNLHANQVIIIDPENGTITEGVSKTNKFGDIDIWEFPRLRPGANHITFNRDNVTLKIKYKPRFI